MPEAERVDAVVVGGGVAGLTAALGLLRAGRSVVVLEAADRLGGQVGSHRVAGVELDSGAESFAVRGGTVEALLAELGLAERIARPAPGGAWLALPDRTVPAPVGGLLGIPAVPLARDVVAAIGARAAVRAQLDRIRPVLSIGNPELLGPLVRSRMGAAVLDDLVRPVVSGVYGLDPDEARTEAVAPGLGAALTKAGSLSGAVQLLGSGRAAGSAVAGLDGGMHRLVDALERAVRDAGGRIRLGDAASALESDTERTTVVTRAADLDARAVVLAADPATAHRLLAPAAPELPPPPSRDRTAHIVTLVLDDARLTAAPRGSGVLRSPRRTDVVAHSLTHSTAKWPWLAASLPADRHVLRLVLREAPADVDSARTRAVADASALLGVALDPASILGADVVAWDMGEPARSAAAGAWLEQVSAAAAARPATALAGGWVRGAGLAGVIGSAQSAVRDLTAD